MLDPPGLSPLLLIGVTVMDGVLLGKRNARTIGMVRDGQYPGI
jgi:hypothetical protein